VQAKHAKELEEQEAKYEKQLQQKEAQLEYAEDSLLRREKADSNALRKKMAAKKLADETQRFMTDKWKTAKDEAEMLRQQLTESKSRMEATKNKQLVAMREQKERDEKLLQQQHAETLKLKEEAQRLKDEKEKVLDAKRQAEEAASQRAAELAKHLEEQNLLRAKLNEAESRASSPERSVGAGGAGNHGWGGHNGYLGAAGGGGGEGLGSLGTPCRAAHRPTCGVRASPRPARRGVSSRPGRVGRVGRVGRYRLTRGPQPPVMVLRTCCCGSAEPGMLRRWSGSCGICC
jgi:hypothetical protein